MRLSRFIYPFIFLFPFGGYTQTNILCSDSTVEKIMLGLYDPSDYVASPLITHPDSIIAGIIHQVSADSLHNWINQLSSFHNRNSGSDTISTTKGIGAAQRWVFSKFQQISSENDNRLVPAYLQFDRIFCTQSRHKNVIAVLPGTDTSAKGLILIEAHLDSRCEVECDTSCFAYGADDNGSGCAMVIELARVMSKFSFTHTLVFMLTTGEEQGLYGAEGFADYAVQKNINIKAVMNNDIVGGVYCGNTASFPGCSPTGASDTLNLRLFSFGGYNSQHKQFARFLKLQYKEEIQPASGLPTVVNIMSTEDRSGRGGDHIPFRQLGFTAVRFTSAFEHGNGNPAQAGYTDRQHTSSDSSGLDLDFNSSIDTFFIDFNYLSRNTIINGGGMAMAATGPRTPDFNTTGIPGGAVIHILSETQYGVYRIGIRTSNNDWDSVYTFSGISDTLFNLPPIVHIFSVASVDSFGIESLFSHETNLNISIDSEVPSFYKGIHLLQNQPNPFDESTLITFMVSLPISYTTAFIRITDAGGRWITNLPVRIKPGMNEATFQFGGNSDALYFYTLVIDGIDVSTKKMVVHK